MLHTVRATLPALATAGTIAQAVIPMMVAVAALLTAV
jgi:hypothetical protein